MALGDILNESSQVTVLSCLGAWPAASHSLGLGREAEGDSHCLGCHGNSRSNMCSEQCEMQSKNWVTPSPPPTPRPCLKTQINGRGTIA